MHEIKSCRGRNAVEQLQVSRVLHAVPSHVRDLGSRRQTAHGAGNHVEPAPLAELLARGEQQLIAEADPQERPRAVERSPQRGQEAERVEVPHGVVKRAVTGQHHGLRVVDRARILGHHGGAADSPKRLLDGAEVVLDGHPDRIIGADLNRWSTPCKS